MGFDRATKSGWDAPTRQGDTTPQPGRQTRVESEEPIAGTTASSSTSTRETVEELLARLERARSRPAEAKQIALSLSIEDPVRFPRTWVLDAYTRIDRGESPVIPPAPANTVADEDAPAPIASAKADANRRAIKDRRVGLDRRVSDRKRPAAARRELAFEAWVQQNIQNYYALTPGDQKAIFDAWDKSGGARFDAGEKEASRRDEIKRLGAELQRPPIKRVALSPSNPVTAVMRKTGKTNYKITRGSYRLPVPDRDKARRYFALARNASPTADVVQVDVTKYETKVRSSWPVLVGKHLTANYNAEAAKAAANVTPEQILAYTRPEDVDAAKRALNPLSSDGSVNMASQNWAYEICRQATPDPRRVGLVVAGPQSAQAFRARIAGYVIDRAWAAKTGQAIEGTVYTGDISGNIVGISDSDIYRYLGTILTVRALTTIVSVKQREELFGAMEDKLVGEQRTGQVWTPSEAAQLDFQRRANRGKSLVTDAGAKVPVGSENIPAQRVMVAREMAKQLQIRVDEIGNQIVVKESWLKKAKQDIEDTQAAVIDNADKRTMAGSGTEESVRRQRDGEKLVAQLEAKKAEVAKLESELATLRQQHGVLATQQQQLATVTVDPAPVKSDESLVGTLTGGYDPLALVQRPNTIANLDKDLAEQRASTDRRIVAKREQLATLRKRGPLFSINGREEGQQFRDARAQADFDSEVATLEKDIDELGRWKQQLDAYSTETRLGGVVTYAQQDRGAGMGKNRDKWLSRDERISRAALAGAENGLAFLIKVLAGIADYSLPGLVEKGAAGVVAALGGDPRQLPTVMTDAAATLRLAGRDLDRRANENMMSTGGGLDVEVISGLVNMLVVYLPTAGVGGLGATIGRAISTARWAELAGSTMTSVTMSALATIGDDWNKKAGAIVPQLVAPLLGARIGALKLPGKLVATFFAEAATDIIGQADFARAASVLASTGDVREAIAAGGASVNFQKAIASGLLGVGREAVLTSAARAKTARKENEMPVLCLETEGTRSRYLRMSIEGEVRTWKEIEVKPAKQRILRVNADEFERVKQPNANPEETVSILAQAANRADVGSMLDQALSLGDSKLAKLAPQSAEHTKLAQQIADVRQLREVFGKVTTRAPLTIDELALARDLLGDGAMGYIQIDDAPAEFRADVREFQRDLAARAEERLRTPTDWLDAKQVEYDAVCVQIERLGSQRAGEERRAELEQRRDELGEQVVAAKERVDRTKVATRDWIAEQISSFEAAHGGKIDFSQARAAMTTKPTPMAAPPRLKRLVLTDTAPKAEVTSQEPQRVTDKPTRVEKALQPTEEPLTAEQIRASNDAAEAKFSDGEGDAFISRASQSKTPARSLPEVSYTTIDAAALENIMANGVLAGKALGKQGPNADAIWFKQGAPFYGEGITLAIPTKRLLALGGVQDVGLAGQPAVIKVPYDKLPGGIPFREFAIVSSVGQNYVEPIYVPPAWKGPLGVAFDETTKQGTVIGTKPTTSDDPLRPSLAPRPRKRTDEDEPSPPLEAPDRRDDH